MDLFGQFRPTQYLDTECGRFLGAGSNIVAGVNKIGRVEMGFVVVEPKIVSTRALDERCKPSAGVGAKPAP